MRLDRLEISGFKSFSDRAELAFDEGVTAIVGPNGCGKSNVADAITWVLGEQIGQEPARRPDGGRDLQRQRRPQARWHRGGPPSPVRVPAPRSRPWTPRRRSRANLRPFQPLVGRRGGTATATGTAPTGMTPTATTAAPMAPAGGGNPEFEGFVREFTRDVEVTRRLYRSGDSEYLIDGAAVRLRDVHELLMDTGLGAKAYSIIEQGKIGLILSSRPTDRRQLIEEAAGITKYKSRRRAAELKLEAAQQNLTRIDDIVFEVEKQRGTLKRQAAKARRYKRLREELRRWEKVLFARRYRELSVAIESARDAADGGAQAGRRRGGACGRLEYDLAAPPAGLDGGRGARVGVARGRARARVAGIGPAAAARLRPAAGPGD